MVCCGIQRSASTYSIDAGVQFQRRCRQDVGKVRGDSFIVTEDPGSGFRLPRWKFNAQSLETRAIREDAETKGVGPPLSQFLSRMTSLILCKYLEELVMQSNGELYSLGIQAARQLEAGNSFEEVLHRLRVVCWKHEIDAVESLIQHCQARCGKKLTAQLQYICEDLKRNRVRATSKLLLQLQLLFVDPLASSHRAVQLRKELEFSITELQKDAIVVNSEREHLTEIVIEVVSTIDELHRLRTTEVLPFLDKLGKKRKRQHVGACVAKVISTAGSLVSIPLMFIPPLASFGLVCALGSCGTQAITSVTNMTVSKVYKHRLQVLLHHEAELCEHVHRVVGKWEHLFNQTDAAPCPEFLGGGGVPFASVAAPSALIVTLAIAQVSAAFCASLVGVGAAFSIADIVRSVETGRSNGLSVKNAIDEVCRMNEDLERIKSALNEPSFPPSDYPVVG